MRRLANVGSGKAPVVARATVTQQKDGTWHVTLATQQSGARGRLLPRVRRSLRQHAGQRTGVGGRAALLQDRDRRERAGPDAHGQGRRCALVQSDRSGRLDEQCVGRCRADPHRLQRRDAARLCPPATRYHARPSRRRSVGRQQRLFGRRRQQPRNGCAHRGRCERSGDPARRRRRRGHRDRGYSSAQPTVRVSRRIWPRSTPFRPTGGAGPAPPCGERRLR
jgi:hypothetical protein